MKKIYEIIKILLLFLLILFVIFFSIMNSEKIKINFDFFPLNFVLEIRLFLLIILLVALGYLLGVFAVSYRLVIKYFENLKDKKIVQRLEKDLKKISINKNEKDNE